MTRSRYDGEKSMTHSRLRAVRARLDRLAEQITTGSRIDIQYYSDRELYAAMAYYERRAGGLDAIAEYLGKPSGWDWRRAWLNHLFPDGIPDEELEAIQARLNLLR